MKAGESNKLYLHHILQTMFGAENVVAEFKFHPTRRWRFDWAIPSVKIAVEYDGHGGFVKKGAVSRHGSITGMTGDCEKYNQARIHGWIVLRFTALYFTAKDCLKHKLTHPKETIMQLIGAMQTERESKQI
jgi:hypothetical protein